MQNIERHAGARAGGPVVWVLSYGEDHEGDLDNAWQDPDGAVHAHGGCDWVSLEPHALVTQIQLT